jgi:hypothetical protein
VSRRGRLAGPAVTGLSALEVGLPSSPADGDSSRPRVRWRLLGPVVAVLVAVGVAVALTQPAPDEPPAPARPPVAVTSDAPRVATLEELASSADLVVRAEVVATERGRVFGEPGGGAVESRLVTLAVDDVLTGAASTGASLLVEEEGWLEDGTPLIVDGAEPSRVGDDGIWFLDAVGTVDEPVYVVVSAQGRFLVDGDRLTGASGDDPLVATLSGLSADALTARLAALPPRPE